MFDIEALKNVGNLATSEKLEFRKLLSNTQSLWAKGSVACEIGSMAHGLKKGDS